MVLLLLVFQYFFRGPRTFFKLVGGEDLKWHQLAHNQLITPQGPHFNPHSTAKTNYESTNLWKIGIKWYK